MIDSLFNAIAPHRCSSCDEIGAVLCESCKHNIISDVFVGCVLCSRPCGQRGVCEQCGRGLDITQAWCVGERRDALKNLIDKYKFESSRAASGVCSDLLDTVVPQLQPDITVVAIPSAPSTVRARGFDHMGRIADDFAKRRSLLRASPLERASSVTLHFLPRSERVRLGSSLFRLSGQQVPEKILLLDDILTTGTTLSAAVALLKRAGARQVYIAVLARQPED